MQGPPQEEDRHNDPRHAGPAEVTGGLTASWCRVRRDRRLPR
jgi:hypothetical protein